MAVEVGRQATEALGPEAGLLAGVDTAGFAEALGQVAQALARRPDLALAATHRYAVTLAVAGSTAVARSFGALLPAPLEVDPGDRRFQDASWERSAWFFGLRQWYLAWARYLHDLVDSAGLEPQAADKAHYATDLLVDALAPTNLFWTNPTALRRAFETNGRSVFAGFSNFLRDLTTNGGRPRQVDTSAFRVGENLACTPGKVVFRNDLMELIQYAPQTETTFEVPLLCSPPWINKYYIMDLAPGRSFVEWAVAKGHTVFAISYRNPDESMRNVALDDYLLSGPHDALDVIADITGTDQVNIVGLCLGGTLTAMLLAHLAANAKARVRSATLLNTLVDFSEPGPMGRFLDRASVERLSERMLRRGYLDSTEMSGMFDLLRARDLIWNYVVSGWLLGEQPPPSTSWRGTPTAPGCRRRCTRSTSAVATSRTSWLEVRCPWPGLGWISVGSRPTRTFFRHGTITSRRGRRRTRRPGCSAGTFASCSARPVTSRGSSNPRRPRRVNRQRVRSGRSRRGVSRLAS